MLIPGATAKAAIVISLIGNKTRFQAAASSKTIAAGINMTTTSIHTASTGSNSFTNSITGAVTLSSKTGTLNTITLEEKIHSVVNTSSFKAAYLVGYLISKITVTDDIPFNFRVCIQ